MPLFEELIAYVMLHVEAEAPTCLSLQEGRVSSDRQRIQLGEHHYIPRREKLLFFVERPQATFVSDGSITVVPGFTKSGARHVGIRIPMLSSPRRLKQYRPKQLFGEAPK